MKDIKKQLIPIIIPAYEPDRELLNLCVKIRTMLSVPIIVVDDGSGNEYEDIFKSLISNGFTVLNHAVNLGKGRALKDAFNYVLNTYPEVSGVITADSDGQHTPQDIKKCMDALTSNPEKLILGCREFEQENIPWKSRFGNKLTKTVCNYLCGIRISDTQTGLRGISKEFMKICLAIPGERFEFETNMLIEAKNHVKFLEIPIETVYESKMNHKTHFDPILDSISIYKIFVGIFSRFIISSLSSSVIDVLLFVWFCSVLKTWNGLLYITVSTILARIISAIYNYAVNYKLVFKSKEKVRISSVKYAFLALCQMSASAVLTTTGVQLFTFIPEAEIKIGVDIVLFFISYKIQRKMIF